MSQIDCGPFNLCGPLQLQVLQLVQDPKPDTEYHIPVHAGPIQPFWHVHLQSEVCVPHLQLALHAAHHNIHVVCLHSRYLLKLLNGHHR